MIANNWEFLHVGIIVKDAAKACDYWGRLGFRLIKEPEITRRKSDDNPQTSLAALLQNDALVIEILQPLEGRFVNMSFLETIGEGVSHMAFGVADIEQETARMEGLGFPVVYGVRHFRYFDTRKIGNVMIELIQRP